MCERAGPREHRESIIPMLILTTTAARVRGIHNFGVEPWLTFRGGDWRVYDHLVRSNARRVAKETNGSLFCLILTLVLFMSSVISWGELRAKYSFRASLNRRLRDLLVRRARRSAAFKTSSGIDTVVFIQRDSHSLAVSGDHPQQGENTPMAIKRVRMLANNMPTANKIQRYCLQ
jgi:hypothetical protein